MYLFIQKLNSMIFLKPKTLVLTDEIFHVRFDIFKLGGRKLGGIAQCQILARFMRIVPSVTSQTPPSKEN